MTTFVSWNSHYPDKLTWRPTWKFWQGEQVAIPHEARMIKDWNTRFWSRKFRVVLLVKLRSYYVVGLYRRRHEKHYVMSQLKKISIEGPTSADVLKQKPHERFPMTSPWSCATEYLLWKAKEASNDWNQPKWRHAKLKLIQKLRSRKNFWPTADWGDTVSGRSLSNIKFLASAQIRSRLVGILQYLRRMPEIYQGDEGTSIQRIQEFFTTFVLQPITDFHR